MSDKKLIGLMPVRNEDWCLGVTLPAALEWCDEVIVLLHACSDTSARISMDLAAARDPRITVVSQEREEWDEMGHRQCMLELGRATGGTHFALIDADEIVTANSTKDLGSLCKLVPPGYVLQVPGYNLRGSLDRYHANGVWGNRWFSIAFGDHKDLYWGGDRFHHREPMSRRPGYPVTLMKRGAQGSGGVMHLWGVNEKRLRAKHALYKLTERLRWPEKPVAEIDRMYSLAIHGDKNMPAALWQYRDVPAEWWHGYERAKIFGDAYPWQADKCEELLSQNHGLGEGLDLFGIV